MKPSIEIQEIKEALINAHWDSKYDKKTDWIGYELEAIKRYLDKQYEKEAEE